MAQEPHAQDLPQRGAGFLASGWWAGSVPCVTRSPCPGRTVWDMCAAAATVLSALRGLWKEPGQPSASIPSVNWPLTGLLPAVF